VVPPRSTLTPSLARVNFEFSLNAQPTTSATPVQVEQTSAAEKSTVETILDDLVEGEPVAVVEQTPTKVVVSETIPAPPPQLAPQPQVPGLLPGMQIMNGVPVKTSVSHPIKWVALAMFLSSNLKANQRLEFDFTASHLSFRLNCYVITLVVYSLHPHRPLISPLLSSSTLNLPVISSP